MCIFLEIQKRTQYLQTLKMLLFGLHGGCRALSLSMSHVGKNPIYTYIFPQTIPSRSTFTSVSSLTHFSAQLVNLSCGTNEKETSIACSWLIIHSGITGWKIRQEERVKYNENEALHFREEINWDRDALTLISTMGTCLHYFRHVLLIVFTLYNILSGNITAFEGLAGIRGGLFCFVEGIIPLKYSNIFILIQKWILAFFFILRFLQVTVVEVDNFSD